MYPSLIQMLTSRNLYDHMERELLARSDRAERRSARIAAVRERLGLS